MLEHAVGYEAVGEDRDEIVGSAEKSALAGKRILDVFGGLAALALFAPIMIAIYLVLLLSGEPPIFAHWRIGEGGRRFRCYKFRSMVENANRVLVAHLANNPSARDEWQANFKLAKDPRVTRFGAVLRRTSMDELPQLFNVLRGEMSLVGPRPIVAAEIEFYGEKIHDYYRCRPGLTGLWQVSGRQLVAYQERVRLDALYARTRSMELDIAILLRTVGAVISCKGAS